MKKIFELVFNFEDPKNRPLLKKLDGAKTIEEGVAILVAHGWFVSSQALKRLNELSKMDDEKLEEVEVKIEETVDKAAELEEVATEIKEEQKSQGSKAKKADGTTEDERL